MTIMPTNLTQIFFIQEVVEPEIPTDPIVEFFVKENNDLKEKLKRSEDLRLQCLEEKMKLDLKFADVVDDHEIKMEAMRSDHEIKMNAMRLKLKKIRKYAINQESWYHYAVGSIVTFVAILIAFVFAFKCINQIVVCQFQLMYVQQCCDAYGCECECTCDGLNMFFFRVMASECNR